LLRENTDLDGALLKVKKRICLSTLDKQNLGFATRNVSRHTYHIWKVRQVERAWLLIGHVLAKYILGIGTHKSTSKF
jgi:hypothetical protein